MAVVRRIFEMLGTEGATLYAVRHELKRTGTPSPSGNALWSYPTLRLIVLDDVYRSHAREEVAELVSPEVAGRLDPKNSYGICWFNRRRGEMRKVVEVGPDGKRVYRKRYKQMQKPRSEWVAVPIADAGIPREWVMPRPGRSRTTSGLQMPGGVSGPCRAGCCAVPSAAAR